MAGSGLIRFTRDGTNGPACWILESDWSELSFITWAISVTDVISN